MDSAQRAQAVEKANEYVDKAPDRNSYKMGEKGEPGENIDCSGVASACVTAGGESDPNRAVEGGSRKEDGGQSGVLNIQDNTEKLDGVQDIEPGNLVTFLKKSGYPYHVGVITAVDRDENDNVTKVTFVHSKGGKGPVRSSYTPGDGSTYDDMVYGYYRWDTKPDTYNARMKEVTVQGKGTTYIKPKTITSVKF